MTIAERQHVLEQPLEHEIDPAVQAELMQHPGEWAAITRSEVLAFGKSAAEALARAAEAGVETPILYLVPTGGTTYYY